MNESMIFGFVIVTKKYTNERTEKIQRPYIGPSRGEQK